jgi:hypothetical protein
VPVILTTVVGARGGKIIKGIQDVFPNTEVIDRTFINTWQDERVVTAVKATKRKKFDPRLIVDGDVSCNAGDPGPRRGI